MLRTISGKRAKLTLLILAGAVVFFANLGGCPPTVPASGNSSPRLRVATFNTACIVPEMDPEVGIVGKVLNAINQAGFLCQSTLSDIGHEVISIGGLTDSRGESEDRVRERATALVAQIKAHADDFDIIALNEVFLEDARDIFRDGLKSLFPYYVEKLEGSTICTEDSGLMLFSRWPLEELGKLPSTPGGAPTVPYYRTWIEFDDCNCEDCLADKGAGYVRIANPNTGDVYHIVFTHMQADPQCPGYASPLGSTVIWPTRQAQLNKIREFLESQIGKPASEWPGTTNVIVMGDLNVVGTQPLAANAAHLNMPDNSEWYLRFDPFSNGGYFAGSVLAPSASAPLYDAWAQTTSPWDPGVTNGSANRLDYMMLNCVPTGTIPGGAQAAVIRRLIPHHLTIRPFNGESDHNCLHAVINRWEPHCTPADAYAPQAGYTLPGDNSGGAPNQVTFGAWPNNQSYDREITVAGGYQWFRFDLPGTYSFSMADGDDWSQQNEQSKFELRVFAAVDLSTDVLNYYGESTDITQFFPPPNSLFAAPPQKIVAKKYVIPEPPFYVRVSTKNPWGKGKYRLYAHRHEGRSKGDAIALPVCCTESYFHGTTALNADDMPWFQINLERPDNAEAHQTLRFIALWEPSKGAGPLTLRLQDEADTLIAQSSTAKLSSTAVNDNDPAYGENQGSYYVEVPHGNLEALSAAANPRFFLRVARPGLIINGALSSLYDRYRLRWETNLTILHGKAWAGTHALKLKCSDETCIDAVDSDEAGMQIWADGMLLYDWTHNDIGGNATDMDSGDAVSLEKFVHPDGSLLRYVESCQFRVLEYDPGGPDYGSKKTLNPLEPHQTKAWKGAWGGLSVPCSGTGSDGEYEFSYNRSRSMQYTPCD